MFETLFATCCAMKCHRCSLLCVNGLRFSQSPSPSPAAYLKQPSCSCTRSSPNRPSEWLEHLSSSFYDTLSGSVCCSSATVRPSRSTRRSALPVKEIRIYRPLPTNLNLEKKQSQISEMRRSQQRVENQKPFTARQQDEERVMSNSIVKPQGRAS